MITKLGILNFQSIEQMAVECGPITVFVGESDSGKSAVVRALYAAAFNDYPSDHVREGKDHSVVVMATENGSVQVEKGKSANSYYLKPKTFPRQQWDRVGRDVPEEVARFLGWRVVELDDGTKFAPSIQRQFDGPFLLADSPSRVAKVLGSLTNISTLFAAIREGTNEERRLRRSAETALEEAKRHDADREEIEPRVERTMRAAQEAAEMLSAIERDIAHLKEIEAVEGRLSGAASNLEAARVALRVARDQAFEVPDFGKRLEEISELEALERRATEAAQGVSLQAAALEEANKRREKAQRNLEAYAETMKICPVCEREWHS